MEPEVKTGPCVYQWHRCTLAKAGWLTPPESKLLQSYGLQLFLPFACVGSIGLWYLHKTWIPLLQWINGFIHFSLTEELLKENGHQEKSENSTFHHMDAQLAHVSLTCNRIHLLSYVNDASLSSILDVFPCAETFRAYPATIHHFFTCIPASKISWNSWGGGAVC